MMGTTGAGNGGMEGICRDLEAEHDALDAIVAGLDEAGWDTPTPAEGWTVRDQVSHLAFFDGTATQAATDPEAFGSDLAETNALAEAFHEEARAGAGAALLQRWREGRAALLEAFSALDPKTRIPWYGPAMSAMSFATARLMETWAHGQDVADAVGVQRPATDRLRHVAHIGVRAMPFTYANRGLPVPTAPVRVELRSPSGEAWVWGDESAVDVVRGDALDFCLLVTQRRHRADTRLEVSGPVAEEWTSFAQAFAGPPGPGRSPGQFERLSQSSL